eukprot:gene4595-biopygen3830
MSPTLSVVTDNKTAFPIAETVAQRAVLDYTRKFDRVDLTEETVRVSAEEIDAGVAACDPAVREAIAFAAARIRDYHTRQKPADQQWTDEDGVELGWRSTAGDVDTHGLQRRPAPAELGPRPPSSDGRWRAISSARLRIGID